MKMVRSNAFDRPERRRLKSKNPITSFAVDADLFGRLNVLHSKHTSSDSSIDSMEVVVQDEDDDIVFIPSTAANEEPDDLASVFEAPLSDCWSIDMFQNEESRNANATQSNLLGKYSFRLVRNSEPQSALYLHGEEIFDSMEAVWEVNSEATFFISLRGNGCRGMEEYPPPPVPISFDVRSRMRCILYRMMWQLEFPGMRLKEAASFGSGIAARQRASTTKLLSVTSTLPESLPKPISSRRRQPHRLLWLDLCDVSKRCASARRKNASFSYI
jgi:hypothetical protein